MMFVAGIHETERSRPRPTNSGAEAGERKGLGGDKDVVGAAPVTGELGKLL